MDGTKRFGELKKSLGKISLTKVLTANLRAMEEKRAVNQNSICLRP